jgi:hypothetical protein
MVKLGITAITLMLYIIIAFVHCICVRFSAQERRRRKLSSWRPPADAEAKCILVAEHFIYPHRCYSAEMDRHRARLI